jgi:hypothetical protein
LKLKKLFLNLVVVVVILTSLLPSPVAAQTSIAERAWNAGAVIIENDHGYGQGYLVSDGQDVFVYTIYHVIEHADKTVTVTIPGIVEGAKVEKSRFECESPIGDKDPACYFQVSREVATAIHNEEFPIAAYKRLSNHRLIREGQLVGSPRPDTGKWTIYQITDVNDELITIQAVFRDLDGDGNPESPAGNFCFGRSGGPVVLIEEGPDGGLILTNDGMPISIGELQNGVGEKHRDYINPKNECFFTIWVNRPA